MVRQRLPGTAFDTAAYDLSSAGIPWLLRRVGPDLLIDKVPAAFGDFAANVVYHHLIIDNGQPGLFTKPEGFGVAQTRSVV